MIEMKIRGIAVDPTLQTPAVVLTDEEEQRYLPIWIGVTEATAIFIQLSQQQLPRPMVHDLLKQVIEVHGVQVTRIVINDIDKNTFFSKIFLENVKTLEKYEIDSRPSDAIALALRTCSPILVAEKVVVTATIVDKKRCKTELSEFKKRLEHISLSDFINSNPKDP
jgi:bifunctional DNase/RNase